jgi:hypothetical protein
MILELEREQNDLLIIAHESVLRVLYGYLMACDAMSIPSLRFPRDKIIEVNKYNPSSQLLEADDPRLFPHPTRMKLSAFKSTVSTPISSLARLKIFTSLFLPLVLPAQCPLFPVLGHQSPGPLPHPQFHKRER